MTNILDFANNDKSTLASSITTSQTTISVVSGTGALFPNPAAGSFFPVTLISAANSATFEICYCTARSGDTLTVTRAQEGTTATAFNAGDTVANLITAGALAVLPQLGTTNTWSGYNTFSNIQVTGVSNLSGSVEVGGNFFASTTATIGTNLTVEQSLSVGAVLTVDNNTFLEGVLTVTQNTILGGYLNAEGGTNIIADTVATSGITYERLADGKIFYRGQVLFSSGVTSVSVNMPVLSGESYAFPNGFLGGNVTDGGATCISYGVGVPGGASPPTGPITTVNFFAPPYVLSNTGTVTARGACGAYFVVWGF